MVVAWPIFLPMFGDVSVFGDLAMHGDVTMFGDTLGFDIRLCVWIRGRSHVLYASMCVSLKKVSNQTLSARLHNW